MQQSEVVRATAAAGAVVAALGLGVEHTVVLSNSNKLMLRVSPAEVVARVAPRSEQNAALEVELARRLVAAGCPVATLDPRVEPRVYEQDGLVMSLWTYYPPTAAEITPVEYAHALHRLHVGMRTLDLTTPSFRDRVDEATRIVADHDLSPALPDRDRALLVDTLQGVGRRVDERGADEQLLHGEPHPGNLLATSTGPVFIDLETCCRGPVEFDLAHAPDDVAMHYPGVDRALLRDCRLLMLAMIIAWRWEPGDQFPDGARRAAEWLAELRAALG